MKTSPYVAIGLCLLLTGCPKQATETSKTGNGSTTGGSQATKTSDSGTVEDLTTESVDDINLTIMSWPQVQEEVAAHRGKIVILDAWSTQCAPCMKEFPNLVALHNKHQGGDVVCMSMSVDYAGIKDKPPELYRERVMDFLVKQHASFQNYLLDQESSQWFDEVELAAIPAVFVYGRDGKLVQRFDNDSIGLNDEPFTYENVNELIEELLGSSKSE